MPINSVDQLSGDPEAITAPLNAAFQDITDPLLPPNLANIDCLILIGEGGIAGDHEEPRNLRQGGNNVFGNPVGEVLLLGITRHVVKR